jgi:hypothetical protein
LKRLPGAGRNRVGHEGHLGRKDDLPISSLMDNDYVEFTKAMETIDTIPSPEPEAPRLAPVGAR